MSGRRPALAVTSGEAVLAGSFADADPAVPLLVAPGGVTTDELARALGRDAADEVVVLTGLAGARPSVATTTWAALGGSSEAGGPVWIYVPPVAPAPAVPTVAAVPAVPAVAAVAAVPTVATGHDRFHALVRTLRQRCPWDRQQTHASLVPFLVEECFELVDALQAYDPADPAAVAHVVEELGDVLFQVEFHAVVGEEEGRFGIADVTAAVHDKLVHRHPHVFADVVADDASTVVANWDEIKRGEKARRSVLDGVPSSLPALAYADQLMRKAAKVGFDWPGVDGPLAKLDEELGELRAAMAAGAGGDAGRHVAAELGDVLASVVSIARHLGVDAELALRAAAQRFRRRFETVEDLAAARGLDLRAAGLDTLDELWDEAKRRQPDV